MKKESRLVSLKNVVKEWLKLTHDSIIDVISAVYIAVKLSGDPLWLMVIGAPSTAKTETIMGPSECGKAFVLSTLTPQTLISGFQTKTTKDASLINKINGKLLIYKDFTSILSMRSEQRQELLAQFREIYDGRLSKSFGTGVTVDWEGKIGFLGGVTPVIDRHHSVTQMLGERFLYYRIDGGDPIETGRQALRTVGREKEMRTEIRTAFKEFLEPLENLERVNIKIPEKMKERIIQLAILTAIGRTGIARNYKTQEIESDPTPEGSPRLTKQLVTIGIALAIVHEKTEMDEEIFAILKKIGRDTIPAIRLKLIDRLWTAGITALHDYMEKTPKIAEIIRLPTTTTRYVLEELNALYLVDRTVGNPDQWGLSEYCCKLIQNIDGTGGIKPQGDLCCYGDKTAELDQMTACPHSPMFGIDRQACRDCDHYHPGREWSLEGTYH